jgi:hypothetical protein
MSNSQNGYYPPAPRSDVAVYAVPQGYVCATVNRLRYTCAQQIAALTRNTMGLKKKKEKMAVRFAQVFFFFNDICEFV